jgi:hypothetical protein
MMFLSLFSKRRSSSISCFSLLQPQASASSSFADDDEQAVQRQLGYLPRNYVAVSARHPRTGEPIAIQTYPLLWDDKAEQQQQQQQGDGDGGILRGRTSRIRKQRKRNFKQQQQQQPMSSASPLSSTTTTTASLRLPIPFPTLYWLTCPKLDAAISELERQGYVSFLQKEIVERHADLCDALLKCHEEYARLRWQSLTVQDRDLLLLMSSSSSSSSSSDGSSNCPDEKRRIRSSWESMRDMIEKSGIAGTNMTSAAFASSTTNEMNNTHATTTVVATIPSIKCLHTHYAHYRSTITALQLSSSKLSPSSLSSTSSTTLATAASLPLHTTTTTLNPVGLLVHQQLIKSYPNLVL